MKWSNLFLAESKYKITLKASPISQRLLRAEQIILTVLLLLIVYFIAQTFSFVVSLIFMISCVSLIALFYYLKRKTPLQHMSQQSFTLSINGECSFDGTSSYTVSNKSRIGWRHCYLNLVSSNKSERRKKEVIIYQDSCTPLDYSRVCRLVKHVLES